MNLVVVLEEFEIVGYFEYIGIINLNYIKFEYIVGYFDTESTKANYPYRVGTRFLIFACDCVISRFCEIILSFPKQLNFTF